MSVLVSPLAPEPTYRDTVNARDSRFVTPGTHASVRDELLRREIDRWTFAIFALTLTTASLFIATSMGFVV